MSREKQIEEMAKICCDVCEFEKGGECTNDNGLHIGGCFVAAHTAKKLYNAGYRKQEWISVDERLPERNGRYLTHCNVEGQSLVCILHYSNVGGFNEGTVTHWMPLPEAPKMKGGAE